MIRPIRCTLLILLLGPSYAFANSACDATESLTLVSATDDGLYEETRGPENVLDNNFDPESRWSNESQGGPKAIELSLGAIQTLKSLSIAWHNGDSRWSEFSVESSVDGVTFNEVIPTRRSAGLSLEPESYDFDATQAHYIKIIANGNASNDWNSIVEVNAYGCGVPVTKPEAPLITERKGQGLFELHLDRPPSENFDLSAWYVTTPADDDGDGKADSVYENDLVNGWTDKRYFYTDPATGAMVFRSTPAGAKTSENTKYTRTELRGMLRVGDKTIATRVDGGIPNKNNWVFSSAPTSAQLKAGGVDGVLKATLAINQVTRLGKAYQVGRVIIGQIHAKDDEPIRLYYRKLPRNKFGSIYFAHEPASGKEQWVEIIGNRSDRTANPDDGIALDEVFSYEIEVKGAREGDIIIPMLHVKIVRDDGTQISADPYDMRNSGFSVEDDFMFFKAGAYSQNNTSPEPETDFDKVSFFKLSHSHSPVPDGAASADNPEPAVLIPNNSAAVAGEIFNDSFADGLRKDSQDASDTNWWTTTNSSALEIATGSLGLVTGGSGRGIRTTFSPQYLKVGQTIRASFSFTTPQTIGSNRDSAFRVGIYDKLGRVALDGDLSASSKNPNIAYDGLPGYMVDLDVGLDDATQANIDIRKHKVDTQGRLLGTTKGYQRLAGGGEPYQFEPEQSYTGTIAIKKLDKGLEISASLSQENLVLSQFSVTDEDADANNFGMLAFHVNSKTFGSSKAKDTPDNGIDFSNVTVEVIE